MDIIGAQKRIMSYIDYRALGKIKFPDYFYVRGNGKEILFYQAEHSMDPKNIEFQEIPRLMDEFKPTLVFVEGQHPLSENAPFEDRDLYLQMISKRTTEQIISHFGEARFTVAEAQKRSIPFISPESTTKECLLYLVAQDLPINEIILLTLLQIMQRSPHAMQDEGFDNWLTRQAGRISDFLDLKNEHTLTAQILRDMFHDYFGDNLHKDLFDDIQYSFKINPLPDKHGEFSSLKKISSAKSIYRDQTLIEKIAKALETNERLMIVYGATHGTILKPALEYLLSE